TGAAAVLIGARPCARRRDLLTGARRLARALAGLKCRNLAKLRGRRHGLARTLQFTWPLHATWALRLAWTLHVARTLRFARAPIRPLPRPAGRRHRLARLGRRRHRPFRPLRWRRGARRLVLHLRRRRDRR